MALKIGQSITFKSAVNKIGGQSAKIISIDGRILEVKLDNQKIIKIDITWIQGWND